MAAAGICFVVFFRVGTDKNCFSKGLASKMLALIDADKNIINATSDCFDSKEEAWYEKYMNYLYANSLLDIKVNKPTGRVAQQEWTYGERRVMTKMLCLKLISWKYMSIWLLCMVLMRAFIL